MFNIIEIPEGTCRSKLSIFLWHHAEKINGYMIRVTLILKKTGRLLFSCLYVRVLSQMLFAYNRSMLRIETSTSSKSKF
jgi:hypothetical protein